MQASARSPSSSAMKADLPPSSRNTFFTVSLAAAMIRRPVAVEPVKLTMSTIGSVVSAAATSTELDVITLTTPAGMSVSSARMRANVCVAHGVSGAPLTTTVHPATSAGTKVASVICTDSCTARSRRRRRLAPSRTKGDAWLRTPRRFRVFCPLKLVEQLRVPADDADRCLESRSCVSVSGAPQPRNDHTWCRSSVCRTRASWSCRRQGAWNAWSVADVVVSKTPLGCFDRSLSHPPTHASAAVPRTSSGRRVDRFEGVSALSGNRNRR